MTYKVRSSDQMIIYDRGKFTEYFMRITTRTFNLHYRSKISHWLAIWLSYAVLTLTSIELSVSCACIADSIGYNTTSLLWSTPYWLYTKNIEAQNEPEATGWRKYFTAEAAVLTGITVVMVLARSIDFVLYIRMVHSVDDIYWSIAGYKDDKLRLFLASTCATTSSFWLSSNVEVLLLL
jgi:hypothetical protein